MALEVGGKTLETTEFGHLVNDGDWDEDVALALAAEEKITLNDRHWDVINYMREQYMDHNGKQPNVRVLVKHLKTVWTGEKVDSKVLFQLFPVSPDKQASKIGGLPRPIRRDGY